MAGQSKQAAAARRGRALRSRAAAGIAAAIAAIVLVNVAGSRRFGRVDLTEGRIYTLAPASRAIVAAVPDVITVKGYFSRGLPAELAGRVRYARELLAEYHVTSHGKLAFEVYEGRDAALEEPASRCGIEPVGVQVRRGDKLEAGRYYAGLCFWYNGRHRAIAPIGATDDLEYRISALIKAMTQKRPKVAFTAGHGERDVGDGYSFARLGLSQENDVVTLNPSVGEISDDVDALVVAGPTHAFDARGRDAVARFLAKGKAALFLIDGISRANDGKPGRAIDSGLDPLLARYGFRITPRLIYDRQNAPGPAGTAERPLVAADPAFVEVTRARSGESGGLATSGDGAQIVAGASAIVFPFASPVERITPPRAGSDAWPLARTTAQAWTAPADAGARAPFTLAYAYREQPAAGARGTRLVIVGSSSFAADEYMQLVRSFPIYAGGAETLFAAVSWAVEDQSLSPLRAAAKKTRPLMVESAQRATALKWGNIVGVPAAFCMLGLVRWRVRRQLLRRQTLGRRKPA